ncbi:phospholipid-binding protein [Helicobacter pylori]|uniref:YbhB/YbcL family Raf kinase inhibitor-like protein n=1 Tax=Helicobacter pylori TaxID=210 RepID=UPI001AA37521|nr:YbhB/YbcL family Raf kinase inhibitor-like protein [Helicobacter pylori]GHP83958.1 phospholipid-binding protein [Helicobacter pylori]
MKTFEVMIQTDPQGYLDAKFGGNAPRGFLNPNGLPTYSPKISWQKVEGAQSYALELIDHDAQKVCGMSFVHWVVGNISYNVLEENASMMDKRIVQGVNSLTQGFIRSPLNESEKQRSNLNNSVYIGPMPPNSDHHYLIQVYALDIPKLALKAPFFLGDLHDKMRGHIIAIGRKEFLYKQFVRK